MRLLLTNDDGYGSDGLEALACRLSADNEIYILAPDRNRSAVSHCVTMDRPLDVYAAGERRWKSSGFPADCSMAGLKSGLLGIRPDAVVSGINRGANMGTDILYSGTCAAARQAVLYGIPAVALSLDPVDWDSALRDGFRYSALADFAARNLEKLVSLSAVTGRRTFVNVNAVSSDSYRGARMCGSLCVREYNDGIEVEDCGESCRTVFRYGTTETLADEDSDFAVCRTGYVAVSSVFVDPVCAPPVDGMEFSL